MRHHLNPSTLGLAFLSASIPLVSYSQVYLTEDQAVKVFFPHQVLARKTLELTTDQVNRIEKESNGTVRSTSLVVWQGPNKETMFVDNVLGKHENILYAVAFTADRKVKGVEILEYRETYGGDVKKDEWRNQFVGKDVTAPLRLNQDIVNISGATLSSAHVATGVKRLLHTLEVVHEHL